MESKQYDRAFSAFAHEGDSMRIAVIGGTGVVGRHTVEALRRAGHDTVVVARSCGVDVSTGAGLDAALVGVETVIDVTNIQAPDAEATRNLFAAATRNLLAAEQRARVRHHVRCPSSASIA